MRSCPRLAHFAVLILAASVVAFRTDQARSICLYSDSKAGDFHPQPVRPNYGYALKRGIVCCHRDTFRRSRDSGAAEPDRVQLTTAHRLYRRQSRQRRLPGAGSGGRLRDPEHGGRIALAENLEGDLISKAPPLPWTRISSATLTSTVKTLSGPFLAADLGRPRGRHYRQWRRHFCRRLRSLVEVHSGSGRIRYPATPAWGSTSWLPELAYRCHCALGTFGTL